MPLGVQDCNRTAAQPGVGLATSARINHALIGAPLAYDSCLRGRFDTWHFNFHLQETRR
jgi:hypothetical protein